jgi:hypothetical protein
MNIQRHYILIPRISGAVDGLKMRVSLRVRSKEARSILCIVIFIFGITALFVWSDFKIVATKDGRQGSRESNTLKPSLFSCDQIIHLERSS